MVTVKRIEQKDEEWVNDQYHDVGFVPSDFHNELVMIILENDSYAGIGRLVPVGESKMEMGGIYILPSFRGKGLASKLVRALVEEATKEKWENVYCIPFEELQSFYSSFGFKSVPENHSLPLPLKNKLDYCRQNYEKKVTVLYLEQK